MAEFTIFKIIISNFLISQALIKSGNFIYSRVLQCTDTTTDQSSTETRWEEEFTEDSGGESSHRTLGPADLFNLTTSRSKVA